MRRLITWVLVIAVAVLCAQDRKKAAAIKELQAQRRWVVQAREEWEAWREAEEQADQEKDVIRVRQWQIADALGIELVEEDRETRGRETRGTVGLGNEY